MNRFVQDLFGYAVVPFTLFTLLFLLLVFMREPASFARSWPLAPVAGALIAAIGYIAHVAGLRIRRTEPWRDLL